MVNTGSSFELRSLVVTEGIGLNVVAEDPELLASAIMRLAEDSGMRAAMGANARALAVRRFDRARSYQEIVRLIASLAGRAPA